jgi:hypothetical protein
LVNALLLLFEGEVFDLYLRSQFQTPIWDSNLVVTEKYVKPGRRETLVDFRIKPLKPSGCRALRARRPVRAGYKMP